MGLVSDGLGIVYLTGYEVVSRSRYMILPLRGNV